MGTATVLYAESTNATASSTTWGDVCSIAAASFTAGKTYLIIMNCWVKSSSTSNDFLVRLVHGGTPTVFTDAKLSYDVTATSQFVNAAYMTVWTQPSTAELIKIQVSSSSTNTSTVTLGQVVAICLDEVGAQGTDWFYAETTADYTTTVTLTDNVTISLTPTGNDDWLIIGNCSTRPGGAADDEKITLNDTVAGALLNLNIEGEDVTNDIRGHMLMRVVTPTAASHTYSLQHAHETTAGTVFSSRIFALNLSKFSQHSFQYTAASLALSATPTYTNIATISPTPTVTGNWFIWGYMTNTVGAVSDAENIRLQINPSGGGLADNPAYGDDAPGQSRFGNSDNQPQNWFTLTSLTSGAARDCNLDGTMTTGTTMRAKDRTILGFSVAVPDTFPPEPETELPSRVKTNTLIRM